MLSDNPYYCDDCRAWLTLDESLEHSEIGHQIKEAQMPTKVKKAA